MCISGCRFLFSDEASINLLIVFFLCVLNFCSSVNDEDVAKYVMDSSAELTLTLPIQYSSIVFGKFLASFLFLLLTLSFTFLSRSQLFIWASQIWE